VVLPAAAAWCETDGTVTNSERRVQRVRKALEPPEGARPDLDILLDVARRLGHDWHYEGAEDVWNEVRELAPMFRGMSYARLAELNGIQWPCYSDDTLEPSYLHGRLWADDPAERGTLAPFSVVEHDPPVDQLDDDFPIRLTTGRRLDSYNTGVQTAGYLSPRRRGETIDVSPDDAEALGVREGEVVRISSRRGSVTAPVHIDPNLRVGLAFMTFHFPDDVPTNVLTIEANDPRSGTAEFKAAAVRIERLAEDRSTVEVPTV
jgi:formate dehydrogenase major subunit